MKDYQQVFNKMLTEKYYTSKELLYDTKANTLLSIFEYNEFLKYKDQLIKDNDKNVKKINLKSFNGYDLHFSKSEELCSMLHQYFKIIIDDIMKTTKVLSIRNMDEMIRSRIYSEVEGTLNIESVPTTRKAIDDFARNKRKPESLNDQIIANMIEAIEFINKTPEFNKDNLYNLYNILSKGCLSEENKLHDKDYYRYDAVEVDNYKGCPSNMISECMDSLFNFVNSNLDNRDADIFELLPHIAHYYILYIHPYFDYNGRTARMVSYWIALLTNGKIIPPIVSEAINQTKNRYYYALSETRDAHNDLTYFFLYIYDISIKYMLTYLNIEDISSKLQDNDIILTNLEKTYLKKILISSKEKFLYTDFTKWIGIDMTKQGALKILNKFVELNILKSKITSSNKKIFSLNKDVIKYLSII